MNKSELKELQDKGKKEQEVLFLTFLKAKISHRSHLKKKKNIL